MKRSFRALPVLALLASCRASELPPAGHVTVHIDTDAPLRESAWTAPGDDVALFDRLRVEVVDANATLACASCARDFDVTREALRGGLSFTVLADAPSLRVRATLFSSSRMRGAGPSDGASIVRVVALPAAPAEGGTDVDLFLATDDVGRPRGTVDAPEGPEPWSGAATRGVTWPLAVRVPCAGGPPPGAACISGGAFWMGSPLVEPFAGGTTDGRTSRIVVLSPFFLDRHELTVAEARALGFRPRAAWDGANDGTTSDAYCTFDLAGPNAARDPLALNCISWDEARALCQGRGGDLPTEAQLELAASGMRGDPFVWGRDAPACGGGRADAVLARAGGIFDSGDRSCLAPGDRVGGTRPPGEGERDRLPTPDGDVVDLVGNLREWALDRWQAEGESCWGPGVLVDPVCLERSATDPRGERRAARGGTWIEGPIAALAAARASGPADSPYPVVGVRCAYPAR